MPATPPVPTTTEPRRGQLTTVRLAWGNLTDQIARKRQEDIGEYRFEVIVDEDGGYWMRYPGAAADGSDDLYQRMTPQQITQFRRAKKHPAGTATATGYYKECGFCSKKASQSPKAGAGNCGICKKQYYCSKECQKLHFKEHKPNCNPAPVKPKPAVAPRD